MRKVLSLALVSMFTVVGLLAVSPAKVVHAVTCSDGSTVEDIKLCPTGGAKGVGNDANCGKGSFLGFPKWYKYIETDTFTDEVTGRTVCQPVLSGLNSIWRIVAAVIEIMLRVAMLAAIGFVVYGGVTYTLSQGSPDKTKQALKTIISALVGLAISIASTAIVTFIAGRF